LYTAHVRLIFWGKEWASANAPTSKNTVIGDVDTILAGPYLEGLVQYGVYQVHVDRIIDLSLEDPPNPIGDDDAGDRVKKLIDDGVLPQPDEETTPAISVVFLPSTVNNKTLTLPPNKIGRHSSYLHFDNFWFSSIYVAWVGNDGTRDFISADFSHELVETLTDPEGDGWQVEPRSRFTWNEIGDVCNSTMSLNGVTVSSYGPILTTPA
jgi:hypothetical protein